MKKLFPLLLFIVGVVIACGNGDAARSATAQSAAPQRSGMQIFNGQCALCHGRAGDRTLSGAKLLNKSTLTQEQMIGIVTYGKGGMMAYKDQLSTAEIKAVVEHVYTLRTPE